MLTSQNCFWQPLWLRLVGLLFLAQQAAAHPVPNSVLVLDIRPHQVSAGLQLPLQELQLALNQGDISQHPDSFTTLATKGLAAGTYVLSVQAAGQAAVTQRVVLK